VPKTKKIKTITSVVPPTHKKTRTKEEQEQGIRILNKEQGTLIRDEPLP